MADEVNENIFLVNAPAGSGKTTWIRQQVESYLLRNPKDNILCITYTNRAAEELGRDLEQSRVYFGTIHSFINDFIGSFFSHKEIIDLYWEVYETQIIERIKNNDRYEVAMHTVGSGLSYAELDEDKLPQTAVIEELNRVENEELRRGYYLGIINQRGVHWIDPEGKPELELAEDYENRANIAESRGYSRYAGILRVIGDEFKREAKSNILEAKNGDDE